ncbi:unnamed protein product [Brassica oleracea var. botrytis]
MRVGLSDSVAALRNPIYSWCAPSVWLRGGGGVTVGQCHVGLEDSRISSSLFPPSASDRWWARVGATVLVSPAPACSVATCVGMAARVAAHVAGLILFSLRFSAVTPGHRFLLLLVSEVPLMLFTLNKVSGLLFKAHLVVWILLFWRSGSLKIEPFTAG